ncbi:MAG TPA: carbonic anhydrase [Gemmatimonadales bacterium]|nr:carbonic anhydrase [Gemmatimonadales bacterium]
MATTDELLAANERYAARFDKGDLPLPPARRVAIVTCMDARIDPAQALGLSEGDAHVIRNAGGRAHEALRSLVISQRLLGTREVVVIHHTDCGMVTFTDDELRDKVREDLGADASHIAFLPFKDLEESVRQDVAYLRASPLIPADVPIRGFVYDVRTGTVSEVPVEETAAA